MLAYEILINDRKTAVAGVSDLGSLLAIVTSGAIQDIPPDQRERMSVPDDKDTYTVFSVVGSEMDDRCNQSRWIDYRRLKIGDEIKICIVETDAADLPGKFDEIEPIEKLRYESAKEVYFSLKEKYEGTK